MNAAYPVVASRDLEACRRFYTSLFGFHTRFEADFYIHLAGDRDVQLGFVLDGHESIPAGWRRPPAGVFITIEADDVDTLYRRAAELGLEVACTLRDEDWGQRHFMVRDPNDLLVDVVKLIPPTPEFLRRYGREEQPS